MRKLILFFPLAISLLSCEPSIDYKVEKRVCAIKTVEIHPPKHSLTPECTYHATTDCLVKIVTKRRIEVGDTVVLRIYRPVGEN
jgi:hypothetical protein